MLVLSRNYGEAIVIGDVSTETKRICHQARFVAVPQRQPDQKQRISAALGWTGDWLPNVDEETLSRYYRYLSVNLTLPFVAHFPRPTIPQEQTAFRCTVPSLIDPAQRLGDGFEGILCMIRHGNHELTVPLIDLYLSENSRNFQLIEDYWHWSWNWR